MTLKKWLLKRKWASDAFDARKEEWGDLQLLDDEPFFIKRMEEIMMAQEDRIEQLENQWTEMQALFELSPPSREERHEEVA
jgi:hypothetical protein